jgi:uncharacterized protein
MKISGAASLDHSPADVFAALNDPQVLVSTIPGCQRLDQTGPTSYEMTIAAGVASIKGVYTGLVELADQTPPHSFTLRASGAGGPGTVSADVKVALTATDAGTELTYDADAVIGGVIAGVGQRVLGSVAKKTANEFFMAVNGLLSGVAPVPVFSPLSPGPSATLATAGAPTSFLPPAKERRGGEWRSMLLGAGIALTGVLVGWLISR